MVARQRVISPIFRLWWRQWHGSATVVAPDSRSGDEHSVFSNGGTAIVIHAVAGTASSTAPPRIACGVITKPE